MNGRLHNKGDHDLLIFSPSSSKTLAVLKMRIKIRLGKRISAPKIKKSNHTMAYASRTAH
jgi:uncharacterized protein YqjF (DUF2071 family)